MKKPGYRAISIILAAIMVISLSGNVLSESGTLFASRAYASEEISEEGHTKRANTTKSAKTLC